MCYSRLLIVLSIVLLIFCQNCRSSLTQSHVEGSVRINKCCEPNEILSDSRCVNANETEQGNIDDKNRNWNGVRIISPRNTTAINKFNHYCVCAETWEPTFTDKTGKPNAQVPGFWFAVGVPQCNQMQTWPIYFYPGVKLWNFFFISSSLRFP